jgi:hypothetical protein
MKKLTRNWLDNHGYPTIKSEGLLYVPIKSWEHGDSILRHIKSFDLEYAWSQFHTEHLVIALTK